MTGFIDGTHSCETADDPAVFREIGAGYGRFLMMLSDLPADSVSETIKDFHNARKRYDELMTAYSSDVCGRAAGVSAEMEFVRNRENIMDQLNDAVSDGRLPLRITHNDTKINNVLIDNETGRAICVIDLDTVMPGLAINDFADAVRSGACTGREDEQDLSRLHFDPDMFAAFADGFLREFTCMTEEEIRLLPDACVLMAIECGMRFLTDYLQGDTYFKTERPGQNLDRCRAQCRLAAEMESKKDEMRRIIQSISLMAL
jgi:Ser/Thr protein kinase RdoA (MazF antagonist)